MLVDDGAGLARAGAGYDQQRPGTIDHVEALRRIAAVPAPAQDPVFGKDGPLVREWRRSDRSPV